MTPAEQHPASSPLVVSPQLSEWSRLVDKSLGGRSFEVLRSTTPDGIVLEPVYAPSSGTIEVPGIRTGPWIVAQLIDHADPDAANVAALAAVAGGATGLQLRFAGPNGRGLMDDDERLSIVLDGIDPASVALRLDPHPQGLEQARRLASLVARRGVAPQLTRIAFGLDAVLAAGTGGGGAADLVACFGELRDAGFRAGLATLDGRSVHASGGTDGQELAAVLAAAAWWLRAGDLNGLGPAEVLPLCDAAVAVDRDQFAGICKLRALRLLWTRLCELCGAPLIPLHIHAETSRRMMTRMEPHTNIVRTTLAAFAAAVGGADSITALPYDIAAAASSPEPERLARNTQLLLMAETQLGQTADASAGSGYVEALTPALCERAWDEFRLIEQEGGLLQSLTAGGLRARVVLSRERLGQAVAGGRERLVGVTDYRDGPSNVGGTASRPAAGPVSLEDLALARVG